MLKVELNMFGKHEDSLHHTFLFGGGERVVMVLMYMLTQGGSVMS